MSHRMLRRFVTAGALAALLALFAPAQAEARELGALGGMLRWLNGFWENGVSALWPSAKAPAGGEGVAAQRPTAKQGLGIDPFGQPLPAPGTPQGLICGAPCEEGPGMSPNG